MLLNGLITKYNLFWIILTKNHKANQVKGQKIELDFNSILEQILSLDTQKKASKTWSIQSTSKPKKRKKVSLQSLTLCLYYSKPGHPKEKCYYKHLEWASKVWQRFKNRIDELKSKANATRAQSTQDNKKQCEANRIYVIQSEGAIITIGKHNPDWYFNNAAFYHITYNLNDFDDLSTLTKCCHPEDNIILADESVISPDRIGTISLRFHIKSIAKKILLSGIWYLSKLDTKLDFLGMLDWKSLSYSLYKGLLKIQDKGVLIMIGYLIFDNLYKVKLDFLISSL